MSEETPNEVRRNRALALATKAHARTRVIARGETFQHCISIVRRSKTIDEAVAALEAEHLRLHQSEAQ